MLVFSARNAACRLVECKSYDFGGISMNSSTEQLLDSLLALPAGERLEIAEALISSLQPEDRPPFDDSWREIIRRRSAELCSGHVTPIPWAEVKRQAQEEGGV